MNFRILLLILILVTSSSCKYSKYFQNELNGGIDGGGGNTRQGEVATVKAIEETIVNESKSALTFFFIGTEKFVNGTVNYESKPEYKKLYPKIFSLLDTISIEIRVDKPCFDIKGNRTDGSIYAKAINTICISPFLMSSKLDENNYKAETFGLIAHELSHLAGFSEAEAVVLQNDVVSTYMKNNYNFQQEEFIHASELLANSISSLNQALTLENWDGIELLDYFDGLAKYLKGTLANASNVNAITTFEHFIYGVNRNRFAIVNYFKNANDTKINQENEINFGKDQLLKIFKNSDAITAYDFYEQMHAPVIDENLKNVIFVNPKNLEIAKSELKIVVENLASLLSNINKRLDSQFKILK